MYKKLLFRTHLEQWNITSDFKLPAVFDDVSVQLHSSCFAVLMQYNLSGVPLVENVNDLYKLASAGSLQFFFIFIHNHR